jgi:putative peptidoglycan lipid II flippase
MVNKILYKGSSIFLRRQSTILSAAIIMMLLMLVSRFLGLWRNWFLARYFGASGTLDAFNTAFVIPDLLANVLITGALSVAFIPIFTTYINKKQKEEANELASSILNLALIVYCFVAVFVFLFPNEFNQLIAPGLDERFREQANNLTRLIIFGEFFLVIGSFFTSVLQSYHRFVITALAPIAYNLGIIFGIFALSRLFGIYGVGLGVVFGALLHLIVQSFVLGSLRFEYKAILNLRDRDVIRILKLSLPRAIGVGVGQLEWVVSVIIASTLTTGSVAVLKFSSDLQNLPLGLFGLTIATAALPTLSLEWSAKKKEEFKNTLLSSLFQLLFLVVPACVLLVVLRIPIVRLVLGSGLFDWNATVATAMTMSFFAMGVFAQAGFLLITRAYYAMHDTLTPLKVAVAGLIFHVLVSYYLVFIVGSTATFPVAYLGLATSLSGAFSFFILFFILNKRIGGFGWKRIIYPSVKILVPALIMAVVLYLPLHYRVNNEFLIDYIIDTERTLNLLFLTGFVASFGLAVYLLTSWWLKSEELQSFLRMIPSFKKLAGLLNFEEPIDSTRIER